ncbi:MAG TPA: hypothetical protein PKG70_11680, partial [Chitinophagales bacterium]|nr:hypothetical protein [Chitinophagales bacterium]
MNKFYTVFDIPKTPIKNQRNNLVYKYSKILKSYVIYISLVLFFFISGNTFGQNKYKLITSTSDLVAGDKYIISSAQSGAPAQVLGYQNTNNRPQATTGAPYTISSNIITATPATVNTDNASPY